MDRVDLVNYIVLGSMMVSVPVTFVAAVVLGQRYGFV